MAKGMTIFGIGLKLGSVIAAYVVLASLGSHYRWPGLTMNWLPRAWAYAAGGAMILAALPVYALSLWTIHRAFSAGRLVSTGIYGIVRHPIYAAHIFLLTPGLALLFRSWLCLTAPPVIYAAFRFFIRHEELWLEATFGDDYRRYRKRVPAVWPRFHR
jgi:protein-S-isoprenylcysteine O-methyltransferase Ste14